MRQKSIIIVVAIWLTPYFANAKTVEAGTLTAIGAVGPSFKLGSLLGGSDGYLMFDLGGEYSISSSVSAVANIGLGFAGTIPLRIRAGARYRLINLKLPVSPYTQVQISYGRLYNVIGANLTLWGVRGAIGIDYFLTAQLAAGVQIAVDMSTTQGERPTFYGAVDCLVYASYALF